LVLDHLGEAARVAAWHLAPATPRAADAAHQRLAGTPVRAGQGGFAPVPGRQACVGPPLFPRRTPADDR
jgi:hypothetical protein